MLSVNECPSGDEFKEVTAASRNGIVRCVCVLLEKVRQILVHFLQTSTQSNESAGCVRVQTYFSPLASPYSPHGMNRIQKCNYRYIIELINRLLLLYITIIIVACGSSVVRTKEIDCCWFGATYHTTHTPRQWAVQFLRLNITRAYVRHLTLVALASLSPLLYLILATVLFLDTIVVEYNVAVSRHRR
jgi:hypothetical protein